MSAFSKKVSKCCSEINKLNLHQVIICRRIMRHRKVHIQQPNLSQKTGVSFLQKLTEQKKRKPYQIWMSMDNLCDTLPSKGLLPKSPLDITQNFSMCRIVLVQHVLKLEVGWTKSVAEVLSEYPTAVYK